MRAIGCANERPTARDHWAAFRTRAREFSRSTETAAVGDRIAACPLAWPMPSFVQTCVPSAEGFQPGARLWARTAIERSVCMAEAKSDFGQISL
jgi:hypothetical protein